jgi:hypothetical protein
MLAYYTVLDIMAIKCFITLVQAQLCPDFLVNVGKLIFALNILCTEVGLLIIRAKRKQQNIVRSNS